MGSKKNPADKPGTAGQRALAGSIPNSGAKSTEDAKHEAIVKAIYECHVLENPDTLRELLSAAAIFSEEDDRLLVALQPYFRNGADPYLVRIHVELAREGKKAEAARLWTFLSEAEAYGRQQVEIEEGQDAEGVGLLLYEPPPVEILPPSLRRYVEAAAEGFGCDPAYNLLPVLAAVAGAVGLSYRLRLTSTWPEPAILWLATVAPSGSMKSPPLAAAVDPLRRVEDRWRMRHAEEMERHRQAQLQYEVALADWKKQKGFRGDPPESPEPPPERRLIVSDVTIEALAPILLANPRGVLLSRDELGNLFASFDAYKATKGADAAAWSELFHGRSLTVDRKTGNPRTIYVPVAGASVVGTIQPGTLKRLASPELLESGLLPRVLFAFPPAALSDKRPRDIPPRIQEGYVNMVDRLIGLEMDVDPDGQPRSTDLHLAPEADSYWWDWRAAWARERRDLEEDSVLAAVGSKLEAVGARLSLLLHLAQWAETGAGDPGPVTVESVEAAAELAGWFWREARRLYGSILEGAEILSPRLMLLCRWLERHGGEAAPWEIAARGPRVYRGGTDTVEEDLRTLSGAGLGVWITPEATGGRGRPASPRFILKPVERERKIPSAGGSRDLSFPRQTGERKHDPAEDSLREPGEEG